MQNYLRIGSSVIIIKKKIFYYNKILKNPFEVRYLKKNQCVGTLIKDFSLVNLKKKKNLSNILRVPFSKENRLKSYRKKKFYLCAKRSLNLPDASF